jgi:hypothetical protein
MAVVVVVVDGHGGVTVCVCVRARARDTRSSYLSPQQPCCATARLVSSQPHTGQHRCTNHRSVCSCSSQPVRASHSRFDFSSKQPVNIVRNVNSCAECVWHARAATRRSGDCAVPADGIQRHAVAAIVRPPRPRPHCRPRAAHQRNRYVSPWHLLSRTHRSRVACV